MVFIIVIGAVAQTPGIPGVSPFRYFTMLNWLCRPQVCGDEPRLIPLIKRRNAQAPDMRG